MLTLSQPKMYSPKCKVVRFYLECSPDLGSVDSSLTQPFKINNIYYQIYKLFSLTITISITD